MKTTLLTISFSIFFSASLFAQSDVKRWALSLHGGLPIMQGDGDVGGLNAAYGLGLKYSLANNFALRIQGLSGKMETKNLNEPLLSAGYYRTSSTFYEGNMQALLNIVNFKKQSTGKNVAQLYVGVGIGYTMASLEYIGKPAGSGEPASVQSVIIPLSGGVRFYINPLLDIGLEYSVKGTFTDHLEGLAPAGTANKSNDYYNVPQAYLAFNLGGNKNARNLEWTEATEKLYEELLKAKQEAQQGIAELKKENHDLTEKMKKDMEEQMIVNKKKSDSLILAVKESFKNDSDGDGVSDVFDKEPNTPAGATVDGSGRMLDSDKDGIPDFQDKCPTVPGKATNNGCPLQPTRQQLAVISDGIKNLQFETGSAVIKSSSFPALDALAQMLVDNPTFAFRIEGHTDNVGDPKANMVLSQNRAEAVKSYLVSKGVENGRITAKGFGDTRPVVSNDTAAGKAKNRRVDMTIE